MTRAAEYLWIQIRDHVSRFFSKEATTLLESSRIIFASYDQAMHTRQPAVVIPIDIPAPVEPNTPYRVPFNGTHLTPWNPLPAPSQGEWQALPDASAPLWYRHQAGTITPAWNLFANLFDLLTFREERESQARDCHGRFVARFSPRYREGLLEVPAFNEGAAALVAACAGLRRNGSPAFDLEDLVGPPVAVLSHDCDILAGNDIWTQLIRAHRIVQPLKRARLPRPGNLWWMISNAILPKRFYFDNVTGMINLEREFGYTSSFYLLNGSGGRYGARSGSKLLPDLIEAVPEQWDIGMHYNYDTHLHHERFQTQLDELNAIVPGGIKCGRAHYFRFDSKKSLPFLESFGIECDESAGYSDRIGYRCGIGGCFQPYDAASGKALNIYEIPAVIMDTTLVDQYGEKSLARFRYLMNHLGCIGGALSLIFHPGNFHNPELRRMLGIYHKLLIECRQLEVQSQTPLALAISA
ncbi:MAG: hypothetical protein JSV44_09750 [Candidatus Zixiibacteriota bacterium]|nr:MAG: hypothetical protein JSV44_09750 [candidate division Zixibacteria bacterium]